MLWVVLLPMGLLWFFILKEENSMKRSFSGSERTTYLRQMEEQDFDLLIIGGGITGAGIALDAETRGVRTALVEMQDFGAGTSSRSTKLVHGGLRYLKQFEIKLVADVGRERAIIYENGPHVTTPEWMLLPIYKRGTFGKFTTSIGLFVYDYLARVKKEERRKMLSREETLEKEPLLKHDGLIGGGYYVEYRTDDARLTIEVMKKAVENGVYAVNYAKAEEFLYEGGKVKGVVVVDQISGNRYRIFAKKVVNAAGPWIDTLREKDRSKEGKRLQLTKGVHLVFDQKRFPLRQAVYFDTPDGRMIFAIPRGGKTYVGTTDTLFQGEISNPRMTSEDRAYILNAVHFMFPALNIREEDVESSWAGVRPLIYEEGKKPSEISRKDEIWLSDSGLITIAGGKLTGYRKMAEEVVDLVTDQLTREGHGRYQICRTKEIPISGGDVGGSHQFPQYIKQKALEATKYNLTEEQARRLVLLYGSNIDRIYYYIEQYHHEAKRYDLPVDLYASLLYGIYEEMVLKPVDFFIRRTGALFFQINFVRKWKKQVIQCMADLLHWSEGEKERYILELEENLLNAVTPSVSD